MKELVIIAVLFSTPNGPELGQWQLTNQKPGTCKWLDNNFKSALKILNKNRVQEAVEDGWVIIDFRAHCVLQQPV